MKSCFFFILIVLGAFSNADAQFSRTDNIMEAQLSVLQKAVEPFYRKPTKKELEAVQPSADLYKKYSEFLRQPDTGLIKLIDSKGCAESTRIINVSDKCLQYTMPGAGNSYSFRTDSYRISRLADINLSSGGFQASGVLLHGIFVNVGDVSLENISLQTKGLKYLTDFQPETNYAKAKQIDAQLAKGIQKDGFLYRRGLFVAENTTFVLRSVAYVGEYYRAASGITYNELDFDKRRDVIVAFRVVEKDSDGNITILWKKIQEKKSPEIKRPVAKVVNP
jgi:hypothetical protein